MIFSDYARRWAKLLPTIRKVTWVVFLLSLPVTNFPFFPSNIGGSTLVRPLAVYPLMILMFLETIPNLIRKRLPKTFLPLIAFALLALLSTALSFIRGVEPSLGVTLTSRALRGLMTLALGGGIYFTVTLLPNTKNDLRFTLKWLYAGFALALFWGSLQAIYVINFSKPWFDLLKSIQSYVSTRRLFINRVSGLTYEPNWFAEQITFLLLPFLLGAVLTKFSTFRWRWGWLTIEHILLGWAIVILPFTHSRTGLIILLVLITAGVFLFRSRRNPFTKRDGLPIKDIITRFFFLGLILVVLAGLFYFAGTKNDFFARIWDYWERKNTTLSNYLHYLGFGARFTYWETAYNVYEQYPVMGVGLGNYAYYFDEMMPDRQLAAMPELLKILTPEEGRSRLITPKNFYLRLLSETGLVGTASFIAFVIAVFGCSIYLWLSTDKEIRFWGTAGLLGMIAFSLDAFSFDSFAIPNMWVVFGLITAASIVGTKEDHLTSQPQPLISLII